MFGDSVPIGECVWAPLFGVLPGGAFMGDATFIKESSDSNKNDIEN